VVFVVVGELTLVEVEVLLRVMVEAGMLNVPLVVVVVLPGEEIAE
jgi:hypothetical protein